MLSVIDVVKVADKTDKKKAKYYGLFDRPYLTFLPDEPIDTEVVTISTVDNGEVKETITYPKAKLKDKEYTGDQIADLVMQAVDFLNAREASKVSDVNKRRDGNLLLLKYAEDGIVSEVRMEKYTAIQPTEIDYDKSLEKHAMALMQRKPGKFATLKDAMEAVNALLG